MELSHTVCNLRCADSHTYVGCTSNLADRLMRHQAGMVHYTRDKLPVTLVAAIGFLGKPKAFGFEKYLISGSGRAFMNKRLI